MNLKKENTNLSRRTLLGAAGTLVAGIAVAQTGQQTHKVTPEGEVGPFFADDSANGFHRRDIRANIDGSSHQGGIPLTLHLTVLDTKNGCAPMKGVQIDIWHCNAEGEYSDTPNDPEPRHTFLRGYQLTDDKGQVSFQTIFPGWYPGRTTHIHLRLRSKYNESADRSDGSNTTQLFFPQSVVNHINTEVAPYSTHGQAGTTNANDGVFLPQTHGETVVSLSGDAAKGFVATAAIYLPITAE